MKFELIQTESIKENGMFISKKRHSRVVDQEFLDNCIDKEAIKFFRNLGGKETIRRINTYTGTIIVSVSTSPCGMFKTERRFTPLKRK